MFFNSRSSSRALLTALALSACAPAPTNPAALTKPAPSAAPVASAEAPFAPQAPLPKLVALSPKRVELVGDLELTLAARGVDGAFEILEFAFPSGLGLQAAASDEVHLDGAAMPYAFVTFESDGARLWVRRSLTDKSTTLRGDWYLASRGTGEPGARQRFHALISQRRADPSLLNRYTAQLSAKLGQSEGPFYAYATNQLRERLGKAASKAPESNPWHTSGGDFAELIATSTGRSSIQKALQSNRPLYLDLKSGARRVPIAKLAAPRLSLHPWAAMLQSLSKQAASEPLASATPAEFYFLRVRDFSTFLDLSDVAESWGTPALDVLDGKVQDRGLRQRYETELALENGDLSRSFGPSVIEELALVGSDPYLVEGSDITLIFRVKSALLFDAALLKSLSAFSALHPGTTTQKFVHEGVEVSVTRSSDGQLRRHRARVGGFELVSNSPGAMRRVISAIAGKAPRLADEPDFKYMLARDADQSAPVLGFAGDRFVSSVIGPQQKIKAAESALLLAELSRPGYAALLYGFLNGHSPATTKDLVQQRLLSAGDVAPGGVAANWQPGSSAQSERGSTLGMLPLIDLPEVKAVTADEQKGYELFARDYESTWSDYVDPFAIRVSRTKAASGAMTLDAELRVLPLLRREFRSQLRSVGDARVNPGELPDGLRVLLGVGKDAELRHLLTSASHNFTSHDFSFDWLGDYAFVGVADRNELAEAALWERELAPSGQHRNGDSEQKQRALSQTPVYAGIAIRSTAGAALALALLKKMGDEVAPGTLIWKEARKHRGIAVMSVHGTESDMADFTLYYALTPHALLLALSPAVLASVIDQIADGKGPSAVDASLSSRAPQLVVDIQGKQGGALSTVLSWLLSEQLAGTSGGETAYAAFHGAPELAGNPEQVARLMKNYFGSMPLTPEGQPFGFGDDGVRDPVRGSDSSPIWPAPPIPGSPVARVLERLKSLRSEVSFDDEPNGGQPGPAQQSLRVHLAVQLR